MFFRCVNDLLNACLLLEMYEDVEFGFHKENLKVESLDIVRLI